MYRFGWKKADMISYYSDFLGMKDTIKEEDMLIDETATEIEQKYIKTKKEKELAEEKFKVLERQMKEKDIEVGEIIKALKRKGIIK